MACQLNRTNNVISPQAYPPQRWTTWRGHGIEGFGSVIEAAAGALTGLCATDLPAWVPVFAASGR
ncbi:hypothetical protein LL972_21415, partial [Xanthomonas campestris pv. asclepiadis]|uniref:hypothetical protein n=1 Tax=Xanthomonas campestris TaxID=339 RepID=UPI001E441A6D